MRLFNSSSSLDDRPVNLRFFVTIAVVLSADLLLDVDVIQLNVQPIQIHLLHHRPCRVVTQFDQVLCAEEVCGLHLLL